MADLFVRKAGGAGGADIYINDLGAYIPSGAAWVQLNASDANDAENDLGNYSSREIRDSNNLFDLITGGTLDWSKDGSTTEPNADYKVDYVLISDFIDDDLDLTQGSLVVPNGATNPTPPSEGQIFYNTTDNQLYVGTTTGWEAPEMAVPRTLLVDEVNAQKFTYVGEAAVGSATNAAVWRIYRLDESGSGDEELIKLYANNSTDFDQIWDDRTTLTYSL